MREVPSSVVWENLDGLLVYLSRVGDSKCLCCTLDVDGEHLPEEVEGRERQSVRQTEGWTDRQTPNCSSGSTAVVALS